MTRTPPNPTAKTPRRATGDAFEALALKHLRRAGLKPVARNFHTRFGEIDLVMVDGDTLVFVEVRYRRDAGHGGAAASVTASKQARLIRAAQGFLTAHPRWAAAPCRFDVVSFDGERLAPRLAWLRDAFQAV
ncbi:YraN family protein [Oleiagrimonas sp. C23AA]|uniref:YraN family protein n=1 Tax=Oleiagrimonas sp. C23AA TaxID=2719047 RepID=UPI0014214B06|nr:YraN family protein [Oleiagrimonas sp. C23AA]NII09893.1 YraN family protein [Oleiagrimonas sp. C23AA]